MNKSYGQTALPISNFKNEIMTKVRENDVVIITAETGAGKSTQVPQYLLEAGYNMAITQPRRLAVRSVSARVAEELGEKLGGRVGYRTAVGANDSRDTQCLFCTDGLALVRELMGQQKKQLLILDEVHEWNENVEVLVAWAKRQIASDGGFKVILMSATLEADRLSRFFGGAPVISVPGRLFPVEQRERGENIEADAAQLVMEGRNVLIFQPGKAEIDATIATLKKMELNAEILPLHGDLSPEEQAYCFRHYARPKVIVSTNVAQTSVTIDDIDAVIDSGLERRVELHNGVEGLYLRPISLADAKQRRGRAGRTKTGIYIDHCPYQDRSEFVTAEILRKRLDQTVLRLAMAGIDMENFEFFHQPDVAEIQTAKRSLVKLGCMTEDGQVTKIGKQINHLPISVNYGRMLIEANRRGVLEDVLTATAIMEQGGIVMPTPSRNNPNRPDWRDMLRQTWETSSDVLAQLEVWDLAKEMTKAEMREKGVSARNYFRAKDIRRQLASAIRSNLKNRSTSHDRTEILKSVAAGMVDHLYKSDDYGDYVNGDQTKRTLGSGSVVRHSTEWLVGKPFDLEINTRDGKRTLHLIEMASKVDPIWLTEVAPQLVVEKTGLEPAYSSFDDTVKSTTRLYFNGNCIEEEQVKDPEHPEAANCFASWIECGGFRYDFAPLSRILHNGIDTLKQVAEIREKTPQEEALTIYPDSESAYIHRCAKLMREAGARRMSEITDELLEQCRLPELSPELVRQIEELYPDWICMLEQRSRVHYRNEDNAPWIVFDMFCSGDFAWQDLPEEGIFLPSGEEVTIKIINAYLDPYTYCYGITAKSSEVKQKIQEYIKSKQSE